MARRRGAGVRSHASHLVEERAHALRAGRAKVARDDALHPNFLRGADDVALRAHLPRDNDAHEDVRAIKGLLEALDAVVQVSRADLDSPRAEV